MWKQNVWCLSWKPVREKIIRLLKMYVKSLFGGKSKDFITAVDEKSIIVVKEVNPGDGYAEMQKIAESILQAVREKDELVHIAYGTIVKELKEVSRSYKEARMALDVGKIFL